MIRRSVVEALEGRQLLSVNISLLNSDFESPVWVNSGGTWGQQAVAPGTQPWNYNELDPRFGTPGWGKTAEGGGGPGPNGEGIYSARNDLGYNQYFNYVNGQLPSPASGTNFFNIQPAPGATYHIWLDQQPDTASQGPGANAYHGDLAYPPMIPAATALAGHTYQVTVALGNPLVNGSSGLAANVEMDFTIGAGTYNEPSKTNSYTTSPQPGDSWLMYDGFGNSGYDAYPVGPVATVTTDSSWNTLAPGQFRDLSVTWTCPSGYDGLPLGVMFVYHCGSAQVCMDNLRLVDLTAAPTAPTAPSNLAAAAASANQINVSWTDNSNNETGFKLDQSTSSDFTQNLITVAVGANTTSYSFSGLPANATYYYRVRATNAVGDSANSATASATTGAVGTPVAVPIPDGDFTDATGYYINASGSTGAGGTYTQPMTGTLSGWSLSAAPSTANGGYYSWGGWNPFGVLDNVTSGGSAPYGTNAGSLGNQPGSAYHAFVYYPGEQYPWNGIVSGAQPGASLTMTTTGINLTAAEGSIYTATIKYANVSWSSCAANPSANVALNILANGVVVGTGTLSGLAQGSPWATVTVNWVCPAAYAGDAIQIQAVASNFMEGPGSQQQWQVPTFAFAHATLTSTAAGNAPSAPSGLTATAASSSQINLSWTDNSNSETGFKIDQATDSSFIVGLTTVTVGANVSTYSATGLSAGTTYYYRVRATSAGGDSANTSTASATTQAAIVVPSILSELQSGQNLNIYAMGTSLTCDQAGSPVYNYGPPYGGSNNSWFDQTVQWLNSLGYTGHATGYDEAQSGAWSTSVAPYPTGGFNNLGQASQINWTLNTSAPPDAVFIEFAINDCYTGQVASGVYGTGVSAQQSKDNLQTMIDQINAWGTSHSHPIAIFVMTMNNAVNTNGNTVGSDRANLATYYQGYRDVAAANPGVTLIDNYPYWVNLYNTNPTQWYQDVPDGIHPNGYGSQYVILPTVETAILNQGSPASAPAAPSGLTATAASSSQINLSWTDNSGNETGFKIDQATSSDFSQNVITVTVATNATTYSATGLSAGTTYYYRVRATNAIGDSENTPTASATTTTTSAIAIPDGSFDQATAAICTPFPQNGTATWTSTQTGTIPGWNLTITPTTYAGGAYNGWVPYGQVFASNTSSGDYMASEDGNQHLSFFGGELFAGYPWQSGWPAYGIIPGQTVQLKSAASLATTVAGATYTATIAVANPLWHTVSHMTSAQLAAYNLTIATPTFELDIVVNGQVVASNTLVSPPAGPWYDLTTTWVATSSGQSIQLQAGASNFAEGQMGPGHTLETPEGPFPYTTSDASFDNARLTVTLPVSVPAVPSGLTASGTSASQISLAWTDNSSNETGFKIDRATDSNFTVGLTTVTVGADVTTYNATGLSSNTTYYFRVRASNAIGDSANAPTASARTATALTITNPTFDDGGWLCGDGDDRNAEHQSFPYPALSEDGWWGWASNTPGGVQPWWGRWNPTDAQFDGTTDVMVFPNITRGSLPSPAAGTQYAFVTPYTDGGTGPLATVWSVNTERFCVKNPDGSTATVTAGQHYVGSMAVGRPLDTSCPDYTLELVTEDTTTGDTIQVLSSSTVLQANITPGTFYDLTTSYDAPASGLPIGQMLALKIICSNFYETNGVGTVGVFSNARMSVSTPVATPSAPSGLTAIANSASQITLNWTDSSNNESGFRVDQATSSDFSTGLTTVTVAANVTTYSATGLASGATYYYRVRATNANGDSANTSTASATTQGVIPTAPSGLTATVASASQINLSWTDNSSNETGFKIDQATSSDFSTGLTTVTVGANVTAYSATGLSGNTTYFYRVRATNGIGDSANTSPASATTQGTIPAAPSGLTATAASSSQINLTWTDNSNSETGFKIDQATSSDFSTGLTTVTVGANVITYNATGLSASTTYYYRVRATNALGDSVNTTPASATTSVPGAQVVIPIPDGDFTDTAGNYINGNTGGGLTFTAPMTATLSGWAISANPSTANGGLYMSGGWAPYGVLDNVSSGSGATPYNCNVAWIGNQPASAYHAFIYYPGEQYNWNNVVGGPQPGASLTMTTTGISAAAVAGTVYTATIQYANVSWSNVSVNPSANVALNILANGVVVGTGTLAGLAQGSPWTVVTATWTAGVANAGQAIQIQVVATNFLEGPGSTQQWQVPTFGFAHATLTATSASTAPIAPSGLTATAASSSQIDLSWTDNSSNETGFKIDRATDSNFTIGLITAPVGANTTTYSDTGLAAGTLYFYRVRATNTAGDSANTVTASATTAGTAAIPVSNGSFENSTPGSVLAGLNDSGGTIIDPSSGPNTIAGWDVVLHPYTGAYAPGGWGSVAYTNYGLWNEADQTGGAWWYGLPQDGKKFMLLTPGEPYAGGAVPNSAVIPGLSFVLTSSGINASAVAGATYTASAFAQNLNKSNWDGTGSPFSPKGCDMTMNILVGGIVVRSQTVDAASFTSTDAGTNWVPFGASWTAGAGDAGKAIQVQIVASNFWDGQHGAGNQWTAAPMGIDNVTLTSRIQTRTPGTPLVSIPSGAAYVNAASCAVSGSAEANALVQVYSDLNNNGLIDGADALVASQQLSGGATTYSISVPLTRNAANNFLLSATDSAGNNSEPADVPTIIEDSIAPVINVTRDGEAYAAAHGGWNISNVIASYTVSDANLVGSTTGTYTFSSEGAGQSHTFTATDLAGNSASATISNVNIDRLAPTDIAIGNASIAENMAAGSTVGNFSTTDADAGDTFAYALVGGSADNSSFSIVGNQLKTAAIFDFETKKSYSILVQSTDQGGLMFQKTLTINVNNVRESSVTGRNIFYNNSYFDGHTGFTFGDPAANVYDDNAIAPDKTALRPGQTATFANYTSYSRGINGIMVDLAGFVGTLSASDFTFTAGNTANPSSWAAISGIPAVTQRAIAGGKTRVTLIWTDATAVKEQWLKVVLKASDNSDLPTGDIFYFGNAMGESGNLAGNTLVNSTDELGVRLNPRTPSNRATITNVYDYTRDGLVNSSDELLVRLNPTTPSTALRLISAPVEAAPGALNTPIIGTVPDPGVFSNTTIVTSSATTDSSSQPLLTVATGSLLI